MSAILKADGTPYPPVQTDPYPLDVYEEKPVPPDIIQILRQHFNVVEIYTLQLPAHESPAS